MRVAAFLMSYPPDRMVGAELMSAEFLEALVDAGHEVTVYADLVPEAFDRNGVHIKPRSTFNKLKRTADLIYSHPDLGSIGYVVAGLHRIPYVAVVHNTGDLNRWHLANHKPSLTVWNSESTRTILGGEGGIVVRSRLKVKDHAVKTTGDAVTLINCTKDKGMGTFLSTAKATPYPHLAVRGGYGLQAIPQPLPPTITPIGPVPHALMGKQVWSKTKILLMPSKEESWGRAGVEALCSGIPVIAHPTDGLKESLGDAGIFIDRDDHKSWIKAIDQLMSSPTKYATASKKAKARAKELEATTAEDLSVLIRTLEALASQTN